MSHQLSELNLLDIGNTIQIAGLIMAGKDRHYHFFLPGEEWHNEDFHAFELNAEEWDQIIRQSDLLEVELIGPKKVIVRKSQRNIDAAVSWAVFKRDGYRCRYCGRETALTVDHIILWEAGGPSVEANLVSACKPCNRKRGSMPYADWFASEKYLQLSRNLPEAVRIQNEELLLKLPELEALKKDNRSR